MIITPEEVAKMLPCPFCGCKDVAADREFDRRVHCYRCGADGPSIPYAPDPKFWDWNSRALIPENAQTALTKMLAEAPPSQN